MLVNEENVLVAPCGLFCGGCVIYKAKDNPEAAESMVARGLRKESVPCPGCRLIEGRCPAIGGICETYECAERHGVEFCYDCSEFPCARLIPAADKAGVLPHNIKVFNLCCIKEKGLKEWSQKAQEIQNVYFFGKLSIGKGPRLE